MSKSIKGWAMLALAIIGAVVVYKKYIAKMV